MGMPKSTKGMSSGGAVGGRKGRGSTPAPIAAEGPSHEEIEARAYELFVESGCLDGYAIEHWLRAEAELRARM
jgi:hypothetical protein